MVIHERFKVKNGVIAMIRPLNVQGDSAFLFNHQQTDLLEKRVESVKI